MLILLNNLACLIKLVFSSFLLFLKILFTFFKFSLIYWFRTRSLWFLSAFSGERFRNTTILGMTSCKSLFLHLIYYLEWRLLQELLRHECISRHQNLIEVVIFLLICFNSFIIYWIWLLIKHYAFMNLRKSLRSLNFVNVLIYIIVVFSWRSRVTVETKARSFFKTFFKTCQHYLKV